MMDARILIVDDDQYLLQALRAALSPCYDVVTTQAGSAAFQLVAQQSFDLALVDYILPDISGLSVLRTIKKVSPSTLVILMTGYGSDHVSAESFRSGARDYLRKPFELHHLLDRIQTLLAHGEIPRDPRTPPQIEIRTAPPARAPGSGAAGLQRAVAFIEAHLDAPLRLDQVARKAGMSRFHFSRRFKEHTGLTFREYLARRRVAPPPRRATGRTASVLRRATLTSPPSPHFDGYP